MGAGDGGGARESSSDLAGMVAAFIVACVLTLTVSGPIFLHFHDKQKKEIAALEAQNQRLTAQYALKEGHVIGRDANDHYYEPCCNAPLCARPRGYVTVDGNSVEDYFPK